MHLEIDRVGVGERLRKVSDTERACASRCLGNAHGTNVRTCGKMSGRCGFRDHSNGMTLSGTE